MLPETFDLFQGKKVQKLMSFLKFQGGVTETELFRVVKERDELKAALLDFEKHMEDIQDNVKGLSTDRDKFKTLLKQVGFRIFIPTCRNDLFYSLKNQMFLYT